MPKWDNTDIKGVERFVKENKGIAVAGGSILGAGIIVGGGVAIYNAMSDDSHASHSDMIKVAPGNFTVYTDSHDGDGCGHYIANGTGTAQYQLLQTQHTFDNVFKGMDNSSKAIYGNLTADKYFMKYDMLEGKDVQVTFTPKNASANETELPPVTIKGTDWEKVLKDDVFERFIKPENDAKYGVDKWEPTGEVEINYLPKTVRDPVHNEEVKDIFGLPYANRMAEMFNESMEKYYPKTNTSGNDTADNETRADIEAKRAEYLSVINQVQSGNFSQVEITYRMNDNGEPEAFAAVKSKDGRFGKAVKLDAYEGMDKAADGKAGDQDGKDDLDTFFAQKSQWLEDHRVDYTAMAIVNCPNMKAYEAKVANFKNETGRIPLEFKPSERPVALENLKTQMVKDGVDETFVKYLFEDKPAEYDQPTRMVYYDTFNTPANSATGLPSTGGVVSYYAMVQVGFDKDNKPIFEERSVWDQVVDEQTAREFDIFVRGY